MLAKLRPIDERDFHDGLALFGVPLNLLVEDELNLRALPEDRGILHARFVVRGGE